MKLLGFLLFALAVTTATRSPALPEAPTEAESGYPGFESNSWQGIVTRAGTLEDFLAYIRGESEKSGKVTKKTAGVRDE